MNLLDIQFRKSRTFRTNIIWIGHTKLTLSQDCRTFARFAGKNKAGSVHADPAPS